MELPLGTLSAAAFTGQTFHRLAGHVSAGQLESAQIAIGRATVQRFGLSTDVLAFERTNSGSHGLTRDHRSCRLYI